MNFMRINCTSAKDNGAEESIARIEAVTCKTTFLSYLVCDFYV